MDARIHYELKVKYGMEIPDKIKRQIRAGYAAQTDKLAKSIQEDWRTVYANEYGESWYEYCIFQDDGETDEEIQDYVDSLVLHNYSQYDCTGKPFTRWTHWKRVPAGIVIIHALGLDV